MRIVKFLVIMFVACMVIQSTCAAAKTPVRLTRLPILYHSNKPDHDVCNTLEVKIARAVHIPLNSTLKAAEFINPVESKAVFKEIWQHLRLLNTKPQITDAVKMLADEMDVDIVICPIVDRYSETVTPSTMFRADTHLSSLVVAEMIIYDRRDDNLVYKKVTRRYDNSYNRFGTAAHLAGECFDNLIKETQLRQLIRSLK